MKFWSVLLLVCWFALPGRGQEANFRQAERFLSSNVEQLLKSTRIVPNTIQGSSSFWYKYETGDGTRYYFVDPKRGVKREMFDREQVAGVISRLTHEPVDYKNLALRSLRFTDDERCVTFPVDTFQVKYDMRARTVEVKGQKQAAAEAKAAEAKRKKKDAPAAKTEKPKRSRTVGNYSPDGAYCAYVRGHDLYLFRESDQKSVRLTEDNIALYERPIRVYEHNELKVEDGRIFIIPVEDAIRIRTGERGDIALYNAELEE